MIEIRIDGPGKNALGTELIRSLTQQISDAGGAPILLTGTGDAFSAGLNLKEVASLDVDTMAGFLERLETFFRLLWLYPGPTAAAVNGHAIAGGCIMAMCCDYAVATDNPKARIGLNEVAIGLRFPPGLLNFVRASISPQHIDEVVLGAGLHSPEKALRLGLINGVVADPVADARGRLEKLARHPAQAYRATKLDLRTGIMEATVEQQEAFREQVVPFWTSPEIKELIRSLLGN